MHAELHYANSPHYLGIDTYSSLFKAPVISTVKHKNYSVCVPEVLMYQIFYTLFIDLVYVFHRGRIFSWPPTSQTLTNLVSELQT